MTDDHRYSLSAPTKQLLQSLDKPLEVSLLLDGPMNASFVRLSEATERLVEEMDEYGDIVRPASMPEPERLGLSPMVIHERAKDGQTVQTRLYPYAVLRYNGRTSVVSLLVNERGRSGEENINRSIEQLEFAFAQSIATLRRTEVTRIAFLEGHGELPEQNVMDVEKELSRFFQVDRGTLTSADNELDAYAAVIIADPQEPFSEQDKYILDQYIMHGGRVLWAVNGVRFSGDYLATEGATPVIPQDLHLGDMLFRYGVRIEPALVQDLQCLPIPVDVSDDPLTPNFQPLPWTYAPLLLTAQSSPVTAKLGQVSATFCSPVSMVGGEDSIRKTVLLATSTRSALTPTPAEVELSDMHPDMSRFVYQYVPVAVQISGVFPSLFAHQMVPEKVQTTRSKRSQSEPTGQIVIGSGAIIRNEWQQGQPLPCGFDRYTQMQFANRDFIVNCVLALTNDEALIALRQKSVTLRLLNNDKAQADKPLIQATTTLLPLLLLALVAAVYIPLRKHQYNYTT